MKKVVITGATGAIGHALIQCLQEEGAKIYVVCRPDSPRRVDLEQYQGIHMVDLDIKDLQRLPEMIGETIDVFYHMAWEGTFGNVRNDMYLQNQNVRYALDAVEVAHRLGCTCFIGTGSQAEYGRVEGMLDASVATFPENGYGMAKLCAGQMTRVKCQEYGIKHIWTRILSVYGPYDGENTMVMSTIRKLCNGEVPAFTAGEQVWDYIYSKDIASILSKLPEGGRDGITYCLGSGKTRMLKEYIGVIRDAVNPEAVIELGKIPYNENQVMYLCADVKSLQEDIGFENKYTFEEGMRETIEWYRENKQR